MSKFQLVFKTAPKQAVKTNTKSKGEKNFSLFYINAYMHVGVRNKVHWEEKGSRV